MWRAANSYARDATTVDESTCITGMRMGQYVPPKFLAYVRSNPGLTGQFRPLFYSLYGDI